MKTLEELKKMSFIPHHDCSICGVVIGWYPQEPNPYFDPSCDCGCGGGHFETWETVFKWYNNVFEKESEEAVLEAWQKETIAIKPNYIRDSMDDLRDEISEQLKALQRAINGCASKDMIGLIHCRLNSHAGFFNQKAVIEMLENHKSNWIPNSKGGEPNHRKETRR